MGLATDDPDSMICRQREEERAKNSGRVSTKGTERGSVKS
jgi:hypothetical protein